MCLQVIVPPNQQLLLRCQTLLNQQPKHQFSLCPPCTEPSNNPPRLPSYNTLAVVNPQPSSPYNNLRNFHICGSCNSLPLVCDWAPYGTLQLPNRQTKVLPIGQHSFRSDYYSMVGFGFDATNMDYNVIIVRKVFYNTVVTLTRLGSHEFRHKWTIFKLLLIQQCNVFLEGNE